MLNQKFLLYSMFLIILSGSQIYPQVPYFLWDKFIENESESYLGPNLKCTPNNEYLITGSTLDDNFDFDLILIKTDHSGEIIWEKEFGQTGFESGEAITVIDSNNYIVLGQIESYTSSIKNIWILKIDENGDTVYTKTIENGIPSEIKTLENNEYIIVGKTMNQEEGNSDVLLIKLDTNCDTIWTKTYGNTNYEEGISVVQTDDLGYLILGLKTTEIF